MFYVGDIRHTIKGIEYGITDTNDNVTEYFNKESIYEILKILGYTAIKGVVHTGSGLRIRITTPIIEYINTVPNNSYFKLEIEGVICTFERLRELGTADGWLVHKDGKLNKLFKKDLIQNKSKIKLVS